MIFQILIPQYKENEIIIKQLLDSIAISKEINFNDISILICNDGSDILLSSQFLSTYNFNITYYKEKHRGIGATRNFLLSQATSDYIMFCDADDMLFSPISIRIILDIINEAHPDIIRTPFIEQIRDINNGTWPYAIPEGNDNIFFHGKIYRRQFLIDNEIKCDETLISYEDFQFNITSKYMSNFIYDDEIPIYIWKWNNNSMTRNTPYWVYKNYNQLLKAGESTLNYFLNRNILYPINEIFLLIIYSIYYDIIKDEFKLISIEDQEALLSALKKFFNKYITIWNNIPYKDKYKNTNTPTEKNNLIQWIKSITQI